METFLQFRLIAMALWDLVYLGFFALGFCQEGYNLPPPANPFIHGAPPADTHIPPSGLYDTPFADETSSYSEDISDNIQGNTEQAVPDAFVVETPSHNGEIFMNGIAHVSEHSNNGHSSAMNGYSNANFKNMMKMNGYDTVRNSASITNGYTNGRNGASTGMNGYTNGQNGASVGTNGYTNGRNGASAGVNGHANGRNGASAGVNGHTNGRNGAPMGMNGYTNGQNGASVGTNGYTHGRNGVAAGVNGYANRKNGATAGTNGYTNGRIVATEGTNGYTNNKNGAIASMNGYTNGQSSGLINGQAGNKNGVAMEMNGYANEFSGVLTEINGYANQQTEELNGIIRDSVGNGIEQSESDNVENNGFGGQENGYSYDDPSASANLNEVVASSSYSLSENGFNGESAAQSGIEDTVFVSSIDGHADSDTLRNESSVSLFEDPLEMLSKNIPGGGIPGDDYPILASVPETDFSCEDQETPGYYADTSDEARCQVFHICQDGGRKDSFLCPNGTLFQQQYFVCDWWFNVDCSVAQDFFSRNAEIGKVSEGKPSESLSDDSAVAGESTDSSFIQEEESQTASQSVTVSPALSHLYGVPF